MRPAVDRGGWPVSWARYDDNFDDHPKVMAALGEHPASVSLHTCANTYSHRNRLNGFVPKEYPRRLLGPIGARAARALVNSGLWETVDGGWVFHDWEDYASPERRRQPSGNSSDTDPGDLSAKRREAGRRGAAATNAKRWGSADQTDGESANVGNLPTDADRQTSANASANVGTPNPVPEVADSSSRQNARDADSANADTDDSENVGNDGQMLPLLAAVASPQPPQPQAKRTTRRGRTQGTRIPDDWQISARLVTWTRTKGIPDHIGQREAEKFKDWWLQSTKPDAEKNDWDAAYRTWINRYLDKQAEAASTAVRPAASKRNPAG